MTLLELKSVKKLIELQRKLIEQYAAETNEPVVNTTKVEAIIDREIRLKEMDPRYEG